MRAKSLNDIFEQAERMMIFNRKYRNKLSRNYADRIKEAKSSARIARGLSRFDNNRDIKKINHYE